MPHTIKEIEDAIRVADASGRRDDVVKLGEYRETLLQQEEPGLLNEVVRQVGPPVRAVARQAGLTGRALAGGAAQAVEPFTEPVRYLLNKAVPGNPVGNIEAATDQALTSIGVPEPQGSTEEAVQGASRFVTAGGLGAGGEIDAAKGITKALGLVPKPKIEAMTTAQLEEMADAAYKAADDANVVIAPNSFKSFANRINNIAKTAGADKTMHPKVFAATKRMSEAVESGEPLTLKEFDILRRVVGNAGASIQPDERRIATIIKDQFDDYIEQIGPGDIVSGDAQKAGTALGNARNLWARKRKSELIEEAVEKAGVRAGQFTGSGFENALRTQFRQIAMNPKRMRGFSMEEQAAIKKVAMGGPLDNTMRMLGKLAPTGVISGGISGGAGYAMAGIPGAAAMMGGGLTARRAATALTSKNVRDVSDLVRRGEALPKGIPDWLAPWLVGTTVGADTND